MQVRKTILFYFIFYFFLQLAYRDLHYRHREEKKKRIRGRVHGIVAIKDIEWFVNNIPIAMPDSDFPSIFLLFPMNSRHIAVDPSRAFFLAICALSADLLLALTGTVLPAVGICAGMS